MVSESKIHPTAVIHPSAELGAGVEIEPYAVLGEGVTIGDGAKIGSHAFIEFTSMGKKCRIGPHAIIGTPPQDFKYNGEPTRLILGDNCNIRECVTLNRGTLTDGADGITQIGNDCFFMAYSHAGHDCKVGNGVVLTNSSPLAGHVTVEDFVIIGGLTGVHQFVRIGARAMIGGGTGVERDIPPFALVQGDRAKITGVNIIGLRRGGFNREQVALVRKAYDTLFNSTLTLQDAIQKLEQESQDPALRILLDFLKLPSKRGITQFSKDPKDS